MLYHYIMAKRLTLYTGMCMQRDANKSLLCCMLQYITLLTIIMKLLNPVLKNRESIKYENSLNPAYLILSNLHFVKRTNGLEIKIHASELKKIDELIQIWMCFHYTVCLGGFLDRKKHLMASENIRFRTITTFLHHYLYRQLYIYISLQT